MSDLNRRVLLAKRWKKHRRGGWLLPGTDNQVVFTEPNLVNDPEATLAVLGELLRSGWTLMGSSRSGETPDGAVLVHRRFGVIRSDTLSDAIWEAWLAMKEKTDE